MTQYKVALWQTTFAAAPLAEIDVEAVDAQAAAVLAMRSRGVNHIGVVIVLNSEQQETFYDVLVSTGQNVLMFTRSATSPRQTELPFIWQAPTDEQRRVADYNRAIDERNRISYENREKPWLPLYDGE